jgi:hypothetical protein
VPVVVAPDDEQRGRIEDAHNPSERSGEGGLAASRLVRTVGMGPGGRRPGPNPSPDQLKGALTAAGLAQTDTTPTAPSVAAPAGSVPAHHLRIDADAELVGHLAHRAGVPLIELRAADGAGPWRRCSSSSPPTPTRSPADQPCARSSRMTRLPRVQSDLVPRRTPLGRPQVQPGHPPARNPLGNGSTHLAVTTLVWLVLPVMVAIYNPLRSEVK